MRLPGGDGFGPQGRANGAALSRARQNTTGAASARNNAQVDGRKQKHQIRLKGITHENLVNGNLGIQRPTRRLYSSYEAPKSRRSVGSS